MLKKKIVRSSELPVEPINFSQIEKKWQDAWDNSKVFEVKEDSKKKKCYVLEMFPYPSATGLHIGHAFNFVIGDVFSRFKRMSGFNVLYPMGYDSLGLPAENAAIKAGQHPQDYTGKSIKNFIKQQRTLGLSYDWTRTVNTADPSYYKWDQWIFLKMFERGLIYQKEAAVNWCSKCNTILANEQVQGGKCWRHGDTDVELKQMNQWFIKITDYADRLLEGHKTLKWPEKTIAMQKNWIGKSFGTEIDFEIVNPDEKISNVIVVHGSPSEDRTREKDYVLDSKKSWIGWIKKELEKKGVSCFCPQMPLPWNPKYSEWKKEFEKISIDENSVLVGHSAGGGFLVRWLGEEKKKVRKLILVSPGKVGKSDRLKAFYGNKFYQEVKELVKEKIVIYTSKDDLDYHIISAKEYAEEFKGSLVEFGNGYGHFTSKTLVGKEFSELLNEILHEKWKIFTTRPDTIFGVTFMVVSSQHKRLWDLVTKKQKPAVEKFLKKLRSVSEKELAEMEKEGVFTGSYAINPANGEKVPVYAGNFVVADYGAGMVMAVPAHDQRDFEFAKKYKIPIKQVISGEISSSRAWTENGKLVNSGEFNGLDNEKAKQKITEWLIFKKLARKKVNFKLRDWSVARQRYWGTPIPLIHCSKCGIVPVPEKDLPVELPKEVKFGVGNPLLTNKKWLEVKCPQCNGKATREANTMDTFVNSSWYFFRYCDPKNNNEIFSKEKAKYWMPIDLYIGGAEHTCMHLIYCRFYTMFLHDLGLVDFDEPAPRVFHQGMINDEKGERMSKSKGNGIEPLETMAKYGVDTTRFFLLSEASPDKGFNWSDTGIQGALRIAKKILLISQNIKFGKDSQELLVKLNRSIKNITEQIETLDYRKSTIELRELFDLISKQKEVSKESFGKALKLLAPFCPHIAEELWAKIGNNKSGREFISIAEWPKFEKVKENITKEDLNEKIITYLKTILEKFPDKKNVFLYVLPFEVDQVDAGKISKAVNRMIDVWSVNEPSKYDPNNMSKKALPGRPGVWLE